MSENPVNVPKWDEHLRVREMECASLFFVMVLNIYVCRMRVSTPFLLSKSDGKPTACGPSSLFNPASYSIAWSLLTKLFAQKNSSGVSLFLWGQTRFQSCTILVSGICVGCLLVENTSGSR